MMIHSNWGPTRPVTAEALEVLELATGHPYVPEVAYLKFVDRLQVIDLR